MTRLSSDMAGRAFCVKVQLDVQAVTCPGVWLCPNGKVALQIHAFESCAETHRISPILPLLFHDKFTFSKVFTRIVSLTDLQRTLEQEFLTAKLIQWVTPAGRGITLATFETNLADLLYPAPCFKGLLSGVDIDLLMEPTKCFPGIIAPKIEVSTKTAVEEMLKPCDTGANKCYIINPKLINSKQTATCTQRKRPVKGIIRQRRVCHTKSKPRSQSCRPYRQRSSSLGDSERCPYHQESQISQCYHSIKKNIPRSCLKPVACDDTHIVENCPVCWKYNCYFSKYHDDLSVAKKYVDSRQRYGDDMHHYRNLSDDKVYCCVCKPERTSDTQEEQPTVSLSHRHLQKAREKPCTTETLINDVSECDPCCEFGRDHSSQSFYKNLEKFYKRMYKQAKIRAQEVET